MLNLKPGDRLQGCEKCQGRRKGEPLVKLAVIEVVSVRREELRMMETDDCAKEGFPEMGVVDFVFMFCKNMKCLPHDEVTRIEFKYV